VSGRTPAQIGKANRRNGREAERYARDYLRAWWPDIDYLHPGGVYRAHETDCGDIGPCVDRDGDHWTIEVKGPRSTPLAGDIDRWTAEAATEADNAGQGGLWVLIVRRPGTKDVGRWHAYVPVAVLTRDMAYHAGMDAALGDDLACLTLRTWVSLVAPDATEREAG